jgi:hypothetical protein
MSVLVAPPFFPAVDLLLLAGSGESGSFLFLVGVLSLGASWAAKDPSMRLFSETLFSRVINPRRDKAYLQLELWLVSGRAENKEFVHHYRSLLVTAQICTPSKTKEHQ